ncbi:1-aminocyclopropane-1-carboxylate oxidase homolog 1 [Brachypodium distachyon]|uniref:Fe2OG dioxygenase domain-containing protein n=1 Tax=Brachypodium distachyon TaxID=15368 RepID=I1H8X8_BRADI|nr:1-aminocyclopropane-1-carboxylate oxidase homolog 1 [Brachypodium distachyon]KQK23270.1 hypothetical protein BRADI_1g72360v3 [Brachypodium distachyon]|eukprot:XP_003561979.1 1-aminocyclopropane-1-carboxylate oxidase homolog 1 [Brachypodium distachyon]
MASAASARLRDIKAFDDTKAGVKGLVDRGVTTLPYFFRHPPENLPVANDEAHNRKSDSSSSFTIPVIDLASVTTTTTESSTSRRAELVGEVLAAAKTVGFFQVVNHGVPESTMAEMLAAAKRFHEEPAAAKSGYYTRDYVRSVRYHCNMDLFRAAAAKWRDTVYLDMAPTPPAPEDLPPALGLGGIAAEYTRQVQRLGATLCGLMSEALGVPRGHLEHEAGCVDAVRVACHYYPACPEPHLTMGATAHSDPSFLTILLQDQIGGLQVLVQDGDRKEEPRWVDVPCVHGALVVNIGDFLQLVSNDRFTSVQHRVVSKREGPRASVACFFQTYGDAAPTRVCTPIALADGRPPRYKAATVEELLLAHREKNSHGALQRFRL